MSETQTQIYPWRKISPHWEQILPEGFNDLVVRRDCKFFMPDYNY